VAAQWYSAVTLPSLLTQGDQIWDLALLEAHADAMGSVSVDRLRVDLVVLTQSCELDHQKVDRVLTAPMFSVGDWLQVNPADLFRLEDIRRGYDPSLYLLPGWPGAQIAAAHPDRIIDLSDLRVIPLATIRTAMAAGIPRRALSSHAREHFSQAVARTFMRVGLPVDIPSFELKRHAEEELSLSEIPQGETSLLLARPLRVGRRPHLRPGTGETYWVVVTKGQNPALMGAGRSAREALASLGDQLVLAREKLAAGDAAWSWLKPHLTD
jgi:hypothetical protein